MKSSTSLDAYQSPLAIREVFGNLLRDAQSLRSHKLVQEDFLEPFHQYILFTIAILSKDGAQEISPIAIDQYLKVNYPSRYKTFTKHQGIQYLTDALDLCNPDSYNSYYEEIKKWTLLRALVKQGIDVSYFFDPDEADYGSEVAVKKRELFEETDIKNMMMFFEASLSTIKQNYVSQFNKEGVKAGGPDALKQFEAFKVVLSTRFSYASRFFTTIANGMKNQRLTIGSAPTGVGKTRVSVANMCYSFAPKYYDSELGQWRDNPHGNGNTALYIGTEMELREEVEPIIWAYMADVDSLKIIKGECTPEEEERVKQAIEYLNGKDENGNDLGGIYLEYLPEFNVAALDSVIQQHKINHNIDAVFFDYMFPTAELLAEYRTYAGNMGNREDQALNFLSTKLKEMARTYEVSIDTWTQVSGEWKKEENRDQTIVRGSKGVIDKADLAFIATRPTKKELDNYLLPIKEEYMGKDKEPNLCLTVYKNRSGSYNDVKIWLKVNYSTMRVKDLFVTNLDYEPLKSIQMSYPIPRADGTVYITTSEESIKAYKEGRITKEEMMEVKTAQKNEAQYKGIITQEDVKKAEKAKQATSGGMYEHQIQAMSDEDKELEGFDY